MFIATGEPAFTPVTGGEWDAVGAFLFLGALLFVIFGYLIHVGPHST